EEEHSSYPHCGHGTGEGEQLLCHLAESAPGGDCMPSEGGLPRSRAENERDGGEEQPACELGARSRCSASGPAAMATGSTMRPSPAGTGAVAALKAVGLGEGGSKIGPCR